jgi:sterol desaturase/sphingolipid hydroxylase (fatty acid hydroxylase superfamily)
VLPGDALFRAAIEWCIANFWVIVFSVFALLSLMETLAPRGGRAVSVRSTDEPAQSRAHHIAKNIALWAMGAFIVVPFAVYSWFDIRVLLAQPDWGVSRWIASPIALFAVGFIAIDLMEYAFHWASHHVRAWWVLHCVHHSDKEFNFSTGLLVHPLAPLVSAPISGLFVYALGVPLWVIAARALIFLVHTFWVHANVAFPERIDRALRAVLVTPAMHRVHHSPDVNEANSNYGMFLSVWDHLFHTYLDPQKQTANRDLFGLNAFSSSEQRSFFGMLRMPWRAWKTKGLL